LEHGQEKKKVFYAKKKEKTFKEEGKGGKKTEEK